MGEEGQGDRSVDVDGRRAIPMGDKSSEGDAFGERKGQDNPSRSRDRESGESRHQYAKQGVGRQHQSSEFADFDRTFGGLKVHRQKAEHQGRLGECGPKEAGGAEEVGGGWHVHSGDG